MSALFNVARNARNYRLLYRSLHSAQKRLARAEKKSKEKEEKQSQRAAVEVREEGDLVDRTLARLWCTEEMQQWRSLYAVLHTNLCCVEFRYVDFLGGHYTKEETRK